MSIVNVKGAVTAITAACAVSLAGCSSSTPTATPPAVSTSSSPAAATTATPGSVSASQGTAVATALDPCAVVTQAEASSMAGVALGAGKSSDTESNSKRCVYTSAALSSVVVELAVAPDAATAQQTWQDEEARADRALSSSFPAGLNVTLNKQDLTGVGDKAATVTASATVAGQNVAISGIYLLKGPTFLGFQNVAVGKPAATTEALTAEAQAALARLP